jgi:hypothetical protein
MCYQCQLFPEFDKVLTDIGLDAEVIRKEKRILSGRTISEYVLYRKGILDDFTKDEINISGSRIYPYHFDYPYMYEEYELVFEKQILETRGTSRYTYKDIYERDNIFNFEEIYYVEGKFHYYSRFERFLQTRTIELDLHFDRSYYSGYDKELTTPIYQIFRLLEVHETLPKRLYLNLEIEFKRILAFTDKNLFPSIDNFVSKESIALFLKYESILKKYFHLSVGRQTIQIEPLKEIHEFSFITLNKKENTRFHYVYFDFLFGNATKIQKLNFQSIYQIEPEMVYQSIECPCCEENLYALKTEALKECNRQLKKSEIHQWKEILLDHYFFEHLKNRNPLYSLRVYQIIQKLEKEFGIEVWEFVKTKAEHFRWQREYTNKNEYKLYLSKANIRNHFQKMEEEFTNNRLMLNQYQNERDLTEFQTLVQQDGFTINELFTPLELKREGVQMGHCVGGYFQSVLEGRSRIFHLTYQRKHSTLELVWNHFTKSWEIGQNQTKFNGTPVPELEFLANRLLEYLRKGSE